MRLLKSFLAITIALLGLVPLVTQQAYAEYEVHTEGNAKVDIKSTQNFSSTSNNSSTTSNKIIINGQEVLNETDQYNGSNSHDSSVNVQLQNGQGTVKYKVNGQEKTVQVTPKDGKTDVTVDGDGMEAVDDNDKDAKEEIQKQLENQSKENKSFFERITDSIKNFFASLFD